MSKNSTNTWFYRALATGIFLMVAVFVILTMLYRTSTVKGYPVMVRWIEHPDSVLLHSDSLVLPVVYKGHPDFTRVKGKERKERFIHLMLPSILMAQEKILKERNRLKQLHVRLQQGTGNSLDSAEVKRVLRMYKCQSMDQLLENIHPHPVSIVLAQAAIETGWGTSRFFREAKNVYGMWSYNTSENRIKAFQSRNGKAIYLRKYENLHDSVYDYFYTVARSHAYKDFRKARRETQNPYDLIKYLRNYSEMREAYVEILRKVIRQNELTRFDNYKLAKISEDDPVWQSL